MASSFPRYSLMLALSLLAGLECVHSFNLSTNKALEHQKCCLTASGGEHRREFLLSSIGTLALIGAQQPAQASYGDGSPNMELPSYIEFLLEKNAVADSDSFLYKGPDPKVQLKRLLDASKRLEDIPPLAADKKWSQVQGILTGPLGTLGQTLNLIAKDSTPEVQAKARKVKETIFSISTAASKKNEAEVVVKSKAAAADLEAFVRAAF